PLRRRGSLITVREMRDQMTALALGLLIGAAGVVGRATAIEPGTTVDQSNVNQVKDLLPPEVYAHFKKGVSSSTRRSIDSGSSCRHFPSEWRRWSEKTSPDRGIRESAGTSVPATM